MADEPGPPWLYPYLEDADSTRLGLPVFRPFVPVSVVGPAGTSLIYDGLIDTGSDAILASDLVADYVGLDLDDHDGETTHAVGGMVMTARYKTVGLRLHRPGSDPKPAANGKPLSASAADGGTRACCFSAASDSSTVGLSPSAGSHRPP